MEEITQEALCIKFKPATDSLTVLKSFEYSEGQTIPFKSYRGYRWKALWYVIYWK